MPAQAAPGRPDPAGPAGQDDPGGQPAQPVPGPDGPPVRSRDDSDVGWGERPEPDDDDERLNRERPPHWDSA